MTVLKKPQRSDYPTGEWEDFAAFICAERDYYQAAFNLCREALERIVKNGGGAAYIAAEALRRTKES